MCSSVAQYNKAEFVFAVSWVIDVSVSGEPHLGTTAGAAKSYCRKGSTDPYPNFQVQKCSDPLWDLDMQLPIVAKGNEYRNSNFLSF